MPRGRPMNPITPERERQLRKIVQQITDSERRTAMLKARRDAVIAATAREGAGHTAIARAAGVTSQRVVQIVQSSGSS